MLHISNGISIGDGVTGPSSHSNGCNSRDRKSMDPDGVAYHNEENPVPKLLKNEKVVLHGHTNYIVELTQKKIFAPKFLFRGWSQQR